MIKTTLRYLFELFNVSAAARNLYRYRELIRTLTGRDFRARFRGSFGGILWALVQPLIMMLIYTLVFSSFLQVKFGNNDSPFNFAVYLLCGLLPWTAYAESFSTATTLIRTNSNLVKRVVFPLEILPFNLVLTSVIQQLIGFVLLVPLAILVNGQLLPTLLYLPLILLLQILFLTGICWIWASLSTYIPDLRQFTALLVTSLMFLTPLFYPREMIPTWATPIADFNPMAQIIEMYRKAFLTGVNIPASDFLVTGVLSIGFFMLGYFWFMHTKKGFADIL
jgi:lipopolysaccharide transport system permease protein